MRMSFTKTFFPKTFQKVNRGKRKRNKSITQLDRYIATEHAHSSVATGGVGTYTILVYSQTSKKFANRQENDFVKANRLK
ncbi:hypothetical protein YC2023_040537 [Brassica napus]